MSRKTERDAHRYLFEEEMEMVTSGREHSPVEIEVFVDCDFVGEFDIGHYRISLWDLRGSSESSSRTKSLVFSGALVTNEHQDLLSCSEHCYFHGGGPIDELAALCAVAKRRRFRVGPMVRLSNKPRRISFDRQVHGEMFKSGGNLENVKEVIDLAIGLESKWKLRFMLAARLYAVALDSLESQSELAFILLVSAIEALSGSWEGPNGEVGELSEDLEALVAQIEDTRLRAKVKQAFWRGGSIRRKFVGFTVEHLDASFWSDSARPKAAWQKVPESDIDRVLDQVYRARSSFLHSGTAIPPMAFHAVVNGAEICNSLSMQVGRRSWSREEYLPHISFVERMVSHVLRTFLERNQAK